MLSRNKTVTMAVYIEMKFELHMFVSIGRVHTYISMADNNHLTQRYGVIFAGDSEGEISTCRCTRLVDCRSSSHGAVVTCTLCVLIHVGTVANAQGECAE